MNKLRQLLSWVGAIVVLSVGVAGCQKDDKDKEKAAKEAVKIEFSEKVIPLTMIPGGMYSRPISLKRGKDATKDVILSVRGGLGVEAKFLPFGAHNAETETIESARLPGVQKDTTVIIRVAWDAKPGEAELVVVAQSEGSPEAIQTYKITVFRKMTKVVLEPRDLALKPGQEDEVKVQAGTVTASVYDNEGKDATGSVPGEDEKAAKGITAKVEPVKLDKSGEVTVTITVAETAAEGFYYVKIGLTPQGATGTTTLVPLRVVKK